MKNYVSKFAMFVALSTGFALAQAMPQQNPQTAPSTPSASQPAQPDQSAPSTPSASQPAPDQSQPAQQPDQSTSEGKGQTSSPDAMPKSDQDKDKDKDQSKMPQSDASAASATGGDVQSQVQTAIQQDPKLANANITVAVKGNKLELTGTVPSNDEKKQAEQIAKSNAGNLKVKNHIKVASGNMPGQDKDKDKDKMAPPKQQ